MKAKLIFCFFTALLLSRAQGKNITYIHKEKEIQQLEKRMAKAWKILHRGTSLGTLGKLVRSVCFHSPTKSFKAVCRFEYDPRKPKSGIIINYNNILELEVSNFDHLLAESIFSIKAKTVTRRDN